MVYMDQDVLNRLDALEKKVDAIYRSVEKTRRYIKWSLIAGMLTIVLPLIALAIIVPYYIGMLQNSLDGVTSLGGLLN